MSSRFGWAAALWLLLGSGMVACAAAGLAWTERQAVRVVRAEQHGAGRALEVSASPADPAGQGRLVHVVGTLTVPGAITDRDFLVQVPAAKLVRRSEMLQWRDVGSGRYETTWSEAAIDSLGFAPGHQNPLFGRRSLVLTAPRGQVGALLVDYEAIGQLPAEEAVLPEAPRGAVRDGAWLFFGMDPAHPQVGDMRVAYTVARGGLVSVLGQQVQGGLRPFPISDGRTVLVLRPGRVDAAAMLAATRETGGLAVWGLRGVGWAALLTGFRVLMRPLRVLGAVRAYRRPWLSEVMATGPFLIALAGTVLVGSLVTGGSWVWDRPFQGCWLIGVGLVLEWLMVLAIRARRDWLRPVEYAPHRLV